MAYKYNYANFNNSNKGSDVDKSKYQAPRTLVSISMRDNRVGCFSEDNSSLCHSRFYNDNTIGALEELNMVLDTIPTNADGLANSITIVYIPNVIIALITGLGDYVRVGKTASGFDLGQEKIDMFLQTEVKIRERSLNLNIRSYTMCSAEFGQKAKAWITEECKDANAQKDGIVREPRITSAVNPLVETLNKQIISLIAEGKFEEAQQVAGILATMNGSSVVSNNTPTIEIKDEYAPDALED